MWSCYRCLSGTRSRSMLSQCDNWDQVVARHVLCRLVTVCQPRHQSDRNFGVVEAVPEPGGELMSAGSNPYCRGYCARPFAVAAPELGAGWRRNVGDRCRCLGSGGSARCALRHHRVPCRACLSSNRGIQLSYQRNSGCSEPGRKLIRVFSPLTMPMVPVFHPECKRCKNSPKSDPAAAVVNRQAGRSFIASRIRRLCATKWRDCGDQSSFPERVWAISAGRGRGARLVCVRG